MVVTGSCLRMSTSETGCPSSQKVDEKVRINRGLQTSCHLNSRLLAGNTDAGRRNNMENHNLSELDQEGMSDGDAVINESVTIPVRENVSAATHRMDGHYFGTKGDMVFSLLSVLGTHNKEDMSRTLLAMSTSFESCVAMRQSGCLPLLIHLLHGSENDSSNVAMRSQAAAALHNIIHVHCEDQRGRQEARVLRLLEQIRGYCDYLRLPNNHHAVDHLANSHYSGPSDYYPGPAVAALMKLSFDEEHRHAVCTLGGVQAIAELLQMDHEINGNTTSQYHVTMRRYACMALTNLTFGDGTNKALLCSMVPALKALVQQVESLNEDLSQVAASVLRNLSWHADFASKRILRDVGAVPRLTRAALVAKKESTLKSLLSALWNFSSHCIENKADICATEGALQFLVKNLTYRSPLKTLSIIENCGGILRNVSSHIAIHEDYRAVLRQHGCLQILLKHLRSPSLTIVSNACGTLWNLSARCVEDQKMLLELGAVNMLKNLVHSKHKMISMGSAAALKNLLSAMPALQSEGSIGPALTLSASKSDFPGLHMRRQKALESELEQQNLSETCDNMESPQISPSDSPKMEMHTIPKNNTPVIEFLTGSATRMTSSLRTQLPADVGHVFQASVDGMTDRKRVNKILHRSNLLLHDRQSPAVVCDSVDLDVREMKNTGGVDLMYGSHSHLQDVKMMHSFSNYCEPTASTSPETSPTGRNMTLDSTRRFFHPGADSQLSTDASADEDGFAKSDVQDSDESCLGFCTVQTTRSGFTLSSKGRDLCEPAIYNVGDESNSSLGKTDFTQNRLSIACSENLFSFDSENCDNCKLPPDDPQSVSGGDGQGNSSTDDDSCGRFGKSFDVSPPSGCNSGSWGHVFDIEDIQGIASEQPTTDIHRTNLYRYSGFQDVEQRLNSSFSAQPIEKEAFESPDSQKPCAALRQNCSNSSGYFHNDVQQVNAGNEYGEKFLPQNSNSGDVEDEELPVSPNSFCYNDIFELKVSVNHDFRRLSSTGSHDSQDDDDPVQDGDDIVIEEGPVASDETVVVDDETNGLQESDSDLCIILPQNSQLFDVLKVGNDNIMPVSSSRSLDLLSSIPQTEFHDDTSFFLQPEILHHSLNARDIEIDDYVSNTNAEVYSDSKIDVFQLVDGNQNANCLVKGHEIFSGDCFPGQTSSSDTKTLPIAFFDESLRLEISELKCTGDSYEETEDFVLVDSCETESKCNVLRDVIEPVANNSCDPYIIKMDRCNVTESFRSTSDSIIDIMNESFPDLSSSLISEMATSHEDFLAPEGTRCNKPFASASEMPNFEVFEAFAEVKDNNMVAKVDEENKNLEATVFSNLDCDQIFLEQELALEENANIILSELEKTTLLGSVGSETRLLEFETLSLVSNDEEDMADRDDESEGSYSLSATSVSHSEPSSERCLSAPQTQATSRPSGPRIVKPVAKDSQTLQGPQKESSDVPKAIRGRRRLLYNAATSKQPNTVLNSAKSVSVVRGGSASNGRMLNTSAVQCKAVEKLNIVKPVRPTVAKTVVPKAKVNAPNAPENVKKPPIRINRGVTPSSSVGQTKPRAPSLPSERRPLPQNRQVKSAPVRSKIAPERSEDIKENAKKTFTKQAIFTPERSQVENEILVDQGNSFSADLDENQDRPKPPIKQDTFVKDASSFSVVVVDSKSKEAHFRKEKEKEGGQVSRSSAEPGVVGCSAQPVRRASPALSSTGGTARGRQQKTDISTGRKNPASDSQIGRPRASYSVPSTAKAVNKVVSGSAGNPSKTGTFNKKPAVPSNASPSGSNCSLSSVGKTSRSSSGYADRTRAQMSDERLSSTSPKQKVINVEKSSRNYLTRRTAAPPSDQPVINKSEKTVQVVQQDTSARGRLRQQPKQPVKQTDIVGRAPVVSTLTRSSTYDKLTEDDLNLKADEPNESTLNNFDTKSNTSKEIEVKPADINPRRLTHVVESTMKFDQSFPVEDDEEHNQDESERTAKSQDCAELTLDLDTEFSITDPLYSGRSLTLDRSTAMSSNIFEKYEEPKVTGTLPENQVLNLSRSTRTSSTLPRSLFSTRRVFSPRRPEQQISAKGVPDDEFLMQDSSKLSSKSLRYKESRKLGFGLWRRNNVSAKGKPESEEKQDKVLQKTDSKAGSPVHKVFGWFRKAGESGKKGLTSRIPGPESSKQVEAGNLDKCASSQRGGSSERQAGLARSNSPLKAAIVQPFNYRPLVKVSTLANEMQHEPSQEPMTKTEMLLARRRQSRAASGCRDSVNSEDNLKLGVSEKSKKMPSVPNGKGPKSGFLVTSV